MNIHQWCPIFWSHYYKNIRPHLCTLGARNVWGGEFLAVNQGNNQNFVPSLISKNHWRIFMGMKQKKISKWPTQKIWVFQNRQFSIFFVKISGIGPWLSRIDWCEGYWCGSTCMVVRLAGISTKLSKNTKKKFCLFLSLCWTASRLYKSSQINTLRINRSY